MGRVSRQREYMKMLADKRTFVALFMAASLMCSGSWAYAMENETELTGGFVPVELDHGDDSVDAPTSSGESMQSGDSSQSSGSSQPATQDGDAGSGGNQSQDGIIIDELTGEPVNMETELSQDDVPDDDEQDSSSSQTSGSSQKPSSSQGGDSSQATDSTTPGIKLTDGSVVTVDDNAHLVLVAPSGDSSVLDDSQSYVMETSSDGSVTIRNEAGDEVEVKGTTVSFTDAKGKQVTVDAKKETTKKDTKKTDTAMKDTAKSDAKDADSAKATEASEQSADNTNGTLIAVIVAAIVAAVGVVFWKRKKK